MEKFNADIKKHDGIDGAYVEIPFDVEQVFGAKRVKVKASFDGIPYRGSIVRMGGCYMIGLTKDIRLRLCKNPGDLVEVTVEKDEEERTLDMPEEFNDALMKNAPAKAFYESLSFSDKRKYFQWITGAKKEETKKVRIEKSIKMLCESQKIK